MKLPNAIAEYLAALEAEGRSPHTVAAYRRDLDTFTRFAGNMDLKAITPDLLQRFMAHRSVHVGPCGAKRAKSTVNRYRVSLKALFAFCAARWLVDRNPTAILKCKRHRSLPPAILTEDEIAKVMSHAFEDRHAARDRALITFMLLTGCRLGETVALNVGDIDLENRSATLRNPKGGDPDRIVLPEKCRSVLALYLDGGAANDRPLFITAKGTRPSTRHVQRIVETRMHEAGITQRVTPHTLRHTFATRLYNRTGDIRLVQQALRHEFITTTQIYAHVDPQRLRAAIENVIKTA
jgi:integrase/recombinase XerC